MSRKKTRSEDVPISSTYSKIKDIDKHSAFRKQLEMEKIRVNKELDTISLRNLSEAQLHDPNAIARAKTRGDMISLRIGVDRWPQLNRQEKLMFMRLKVLNISKLIDAIGAGRVFDKLVGYAPKVIGSGVEGAVVSGDSDGIPIIAKMKIGVVDMTDLYHELLVGIYLNKLHTVGDNFLLMYGMIPGCNLPYRAGAKGDVRSYNSCNHKRAANATTISTSDLSAHLLAEHIDGITFSKYIDGLLISAMEAGDISGQQKAVRDIMLALLQVLCAISVAYKMYKFTHGDLHAGNIMITDIDNIDRRYQLSKSIITLRTDKRIVIFDYGFSSINVNCDIYSNVTGMTSIDVGNNIDFTSGASIPWFDTFRLMGSMCANTINAAETFNLPYIADSFTRLYGLMTANANDIIGRRVQGESVEKDVDYVKIGKKNLEHAKKVGNTFFYSNTTNVNLPSSECMVQIILRDELFGDVLKGLVGTSSAGSVYNMMKRVSGKLDNHLSDGYVATDEIDLLRLSSLGVQVTADQASSMLAGRVDELYKRLVNAQLPEGYSPDLRSIKKILNGKGKIPITIMNEITPVLELYDAVTSIKSAVDLFPVKIVVRGLDKLITDTNALIIKVSRYMDTLSFSFYELFTRINISSAIASVKPYLSEMYGYAPRSISIAIRDHDRIASLMGSNKNPVAKYWIGGEQRSYVPIKVDGHQEEWKNATRIFSMYLIDNESSRNKNLAPNVVAMWSLISMYRGMETIQRPTRASRAQQQSMQRPGAT